jgi:hypothetical protein
MGGKGSGRQTVSHEEFRRAVLRKAWTLTGEQLNGSSTDRYKTAEALVLKDMAQKIEAQQDINMTLTQEERSILDKYSAFNRLAQGQG